MKRVLLDTNIYGELAIDPELERIVNQVVDRKKVIVHGCKVIRDELRNIPRHEFSARGRQLRMDALSFYDDFVRDRSVVITAPILRLAGNYYWTYRELGGSKPWRAICNDFVIVAAASDKLLDIVVSQDEATMRSDTALKAYEIANNLLRLRMPKFIAYEKFKEMLRQEV